MAGEEDFRPSVLKQADEDVFADDFDAARLLCFGIVVKQLVEKHIFPGQPSHVFPHVERDGFALLFGQFGVGRAQIVDGNPVPPEQRADPAGHAPDHGQGGVCREQFDQCQRGGNAGCLKPIDAISAKGDDPAQQTRHDDLSLGAYPKNDLAEHVAAFHGGQRIRNRVEGDFPVNDRMNLSFGHLAHRVDHVLHAATE